MPCFSVLYSSILQEDPTEKNKFYSDLRSRLRSTPANDKVVILDDLNARGQSGPRLCGLEGSPSEKWCW